MLEFTAIDYYTLADAQTYGPSFRVREYPGLVPLFAADYTEGAMGYMDDCDYLLGHTGGRVSMRMVYRYLYEWSERNRRPFTMEEFPKLLKESTGLDVSEIYQKWQGPVEDR